MGKSINTGCGCLLALLVAGAIGVGVIYGCLGGLSWIGAQAEIASTQPTEPEFKVDASDSAQRRRKELIEQYQKLGIIRKIETPGYIPRVTVGPGFYALNVDDKKTTLGLVLAYCYVIDNRIKRIGVYEEMNGQKIGNYDAQFGWDPE